MTKRWLTLGLLLALLFFSAISTTHAQPRRGGFGGGLPKVGTTLPDLTVYTPDGKELKTSSLRGKHVVLTFGCLT